MNEKNSIVKKIIEKWYKKLSFPLEFDNEFYNAISVYEINEDISIETYDFTSEDGKKNLLSFLYMCENAYNEYLKLNIPDDIIIETLKDIVNWTKVWSKIKNELYLGEIFWLKKHLLCKIFRIGRLQFIPSQFRKDYEIAKIKKGENVVEIHIPEGGKLTKEAVDNSITLAKDFFAKYFPHFQYKYFSCDSWLLDETIKKYFKKDSNVVAFGNRFTKLENKKSNAILKYLISWDTTIENLAKKETGSSLTTTIKQASLNGETFYETFGIFEK